MRIPYEARGRVQQKARTREALLAAVHALLRQGRTPTVEEAARAAGISRTTAYRYFPTQHDLLVAVHPEIDAASLIGDDPPADPEARLDLVLANIGRQILENAPELRTALRLSLDPGTDRRQLLLRQGRAIRWLEDALRPLRGRVPERKMRQLVLAIRATFGIEAFVWLTDVAALSPEEAVTLMRWSAKTLFRAVLREAPEISPGATRATRGSRRSGTRAPNTGRLAGPPSRR